VDFQHVLLTPAPALPTPAGPQPVDVTNAYKYYWLLAILDHVRDGGAATAAIDELVARMVAAVWYPSNYFRLSFGKHDKLGEAALVLCEAAQLPPNAPRAQVMDTARAHMAAGSVAGRLIRRLDKYVVYRFLRPFFAAQVRGAPDWAVNRRVVALAEQRFARGDAPSLYRFVDEGRSIELHPRGQAYLPHNLAIATGLCRWTLVTYLQRNNPTVPTVAGKLAEPGQGDKA